MLEVIPKKNNYKFFLSDSAYGNTLFRMADSNARYWAKIRKVVENLQWFEREETSQCGIYMLMLDGTTQYIGKSFNVDGRLAAHRNEGRMAFDAVRFAAVDPEILADVEKEIIYCYQPPRNKIFKTAPRGPIWRGELLRKIQIPNRDNS